MTSVITRPLVFPALCRSLHLYPVSFRLRCSPNRRSAVKTCGTVVKTCHPATNDLGVVSKHVQFHSFTVHIVLTLLCKRIPVDCGEYVHMNGIRALIAAWLNTSQIYRHGVRINISVLRVSVRLIYHLAVIRIRYRAISGMTFTLSPTYLTSVWRSGTQMSSLRINLLCVDSPSRPREPVASVVAALRPLRVLLLNDFIVLHNTAAFCDGKVV